MDIIKGYITEFTSRFVFPRVELTDAIEILFLAFIIYHISIWIRNSRAWMLLKGIIFLLGIALVAALLQLNVILWLPTKVIFATEDILAAAMYGVPTDPPDFYKPRIS